MTKENVALWKTAYEAMEIITSNSSIVFHPYELALMTYEFVRDIENLNGAEIMRKLNMLEVVLYECKAKEDFETAAKILIIIREMNMHIDDLTI